MRLEPDEIVDVSGRIVAPSVLTCLLDSVVTPRFGGGTVSDELGLPVTDSGLVLPCGATGRWTREGRA